MSYNFSDFQQISKLYFVLQEIFRVAVLNEKKEENELLLLSENIKSTTKTTTKINNKNKNNDLKISNEITKKRKKS